MVGVARRRPRSLAVELAVGDGNTPASVAAQNKVLAPDEGGGNMVDPDHVGVVQGDGISTPDVLRVEIGDVDVLDDDVLGTADHAEAFALDDPLASDTDQGLVRPDSDAENAGLVVLDRHLGGVGLVVGAPVVEVDGRLATRAGAPRSAASLGDSALGSSEVKGPVEHDDAGLGVTEVRDQLGSGRRIHSRGAASAGDALGEALSRTGDGCGGLGQHGNGRGQQSGRPHGDA